MPSVYVLHIVNASVVYMYTYVGYSLCTSSDQFPVHGRYVYVHGDYWCENAVQCSVLNAL